MYIGLEYKEHSHKYNVEQIKAALKTAFFSPCSTLLLLQELHLGHLEGWY